MLDVSFSKFPRRTGISFSEGLRKIISRTKATGLPNLGDALFRIQQLMVREGKLRSLLSAGQGLIRNGCRGHLHRCLPFHDPETGKTIYGPVPAYGINPETGEREQVGTYELDPETGIVTFLNI